MGGDDDGDGEGFDVSMIVEQLGSNVGWDSAENSTYLL